MGFLSKLLTFGEGKQLKRYQSLVDKIGSLEPSMQALTDAELVALTAAYKERAANGESLDSLLPEAFAHGAPRPASVLWACVILTCSSLAAWRFMKAKLPK